MPLNLASPGILVREVDLTVGRIDPATTKTGGIVAPFAQGPVDLPTLIENENDLLATFGKPYSKDKHYEHWLTASSYLAYGGVLRVVRCDDDQLTNSCIGVGTTVRIKSLDHYIQLGYDENTISNITFAAKNPGSWANGLKVAIIDSKADQILSGINTSSATSFNTVISASGTVGAASSIITGITTTSIALGQTLLPIDGIIGSGTTVAAIGVGTVYLGTSSLNVAPSSQTFSFGSYVGVTTSIAVGYGITQSLYGTVNPGIGTTTVLTGHLKGVVTEVGVSKISVKVLSYVENGTETAVDYQQSGTWRFSNTGSVAIHTTGQATSYGSTAYTGNLDWFDQQLINTTPTNGLTTSYIQWNQISQRPGTSEFAESRGSRFDEIHIVVIDTDGKVTGNAGTILEKHLTLSKAKDAQFSAGSPSYWRKYLADNSDYLFGGSQPAGIVTTGFSSGFTLQSDDDWDQEAAGIIFSAAGSVTNTLQYGKNYDGATEISNTGALGATLGKISSGYTLFENTENYKIDFLLMGSAGYSKNDTQALAQKLIAIAEARKDAIAFISPYRGSAITDTSSETAISVNSIDDITDNVLSFYAPITSSTYAVFDTGYKYMYDRFNDTFRYVPLNGDIAGCCARTDINNFPWFSPAGTSRGTILNAVKLSYNPGKIQRDKLYSNRINPVIFSPGSGIILFGDKTGYAKASAFDRINVRRLFIYLENAISAAAKDQLFEFNDEITRTNFVNIVEPFLRDVQAKRGIFDYVVVCDETNNTAAVIDSNEFVADIYIKPARSINFIGLTFIATRTGVSFEEVIGNV